jgi:hypothetical protein
MASLHTTTHDEEDTTPLLALTRMEDSREETAKGEEGKSKKKIIAVDESKPLAEQIYFDLHGI